jgi:hypothetical protein
MLEAAVDLSVVDHNPEQALVGGNIGEAELNRRSPPRHDFDVHAQMHVPHQMMRIEIVGVEIAAPPVAPHAERIDDVSELDSSRRQAILRFVSDIGSNSLRHAGLLERAQSVR